MLTYEQWVEDLKGVPDEQQAAWIFETLKNKKHLHIFGRYFFPHIVKGTDAVPECHRELIDEIAKPIDSGIIFPRGFAKSTWEKIDTIHDIVYGIEPVILYISVTLSDAQFHFESIKAELENNDLLITIYGNLVPDFMAQGKKWTNRHFETTNNINVVARGAGKGRGVNIKNQRPTKIIADDIEDDEHIQSPKQRLKIHNWLYNVIFPSKDKERGRIKMIGTVIHTQAEVLQFYLGHGGIFRRAIEDGKSIWPNYWSLDDLEKMKNGYINEKGQHIQGIGTRAFMQEYMNEPTSDEMANFKPEWIDGNIFTELPKENRWEMVIAMDPQAGETDAADEFCITVLAWAPKDRHRYVLEQVAGRSSQLEQAKIFIQTWMRYPVAHAVGIEKVLNQTAVYQYVLDWKNGKIKFPGIPSGNRNIPVRGISPADTKSKYGKDKLARLQGHEAEFERGEIHLRPEMKTLRDQILFMGKGVMEHDDRADSLLLALDMSYTGNFGDKEQVVYTGQEKPVSTVAGNLYKAQY